MSSHEQRKKPESESGQADSGVMTDAADPRSAPDGSERPIEIGGRKGPEPTRFGDWEKNGRCIDF